MLVEMKCEGTNGKINDSEVLFMLTTHSVLYNQSRIVILIYLRRNRIHIIVFYHA